jgi:3-oxoacyl-[acyl-carrier-protein] synthase III
MVVIQLDKVFMLNRTAKISASKILGVVTCLPNQIVSNDYFLNLLTQTEIDNIEKMAGVKTRYWVNDESSSDLCIAAGRRLISQLNWDVAEIDALIYVTQSPDYVLPATSIKIAGELGLKPGVIAYDVNLGCSGYPYGLFLAESMIQTGIANRVLLVVGETTSKIIDKKDKSTALIFGDAGAVTALEASQDNESCYLLGSDAAGEKNLIVPNSRFCKNVMINDLRMNGRNPDFIFMDGAEVFNFTLKRVPPLVKNTEEMFGSEINFYLFHQANKFMLNHLVKKMKIESAKVPINIDLFGNTSSVSIPLLMTTNIKNYFALNSVKHVNLGMFGFGVGYSWSSCAKRVDSNILLENIFLND